MIGEVAFKNLSDKEWLYNQYVCLGKPTRIIASELGCGKKAVNTFLKRHNIPVKRSNRGMFKSTNDKCADFWYDSYWEYMIARRLDDDVSVVKFVKDPFPIPYVDSNKKCRRYIPDFLVILTRGNCFVLEVKPDGLLPYVECKIRAANQLGLKFVVINVDDAFPWGRFGR